MILIEYPPPAPPPAGDKISFSEYGHCVSVGPGGLEPDFFSLISRITQIGPCWRFGGQKRNGAKETKAQRDFRRGENGFNTEERRRRGEGKVKSKK